MPHNHDQIIHGHITRLKLRVHVDSARSQAIESIVSPLSWFLSLGTFVLFVYWMVFDSGLRELFPAYYQVLVSIVLNVPGHPSKIDSLLATQGYVSWWNLSEAIQQVEASISVGHQGH